MSDLVELRKRLAAAQPVDFEVVYDVLYEALDELAVLRLRIQSAEKRLDGNGQLDPEASSIEEIRHWVCATRSEEEGR